MQTKRQSGDIDLDAVGRLVHDLERDLEKVRQGAGDVDALRGEVAALQDALRAAQPDDRHIDRGLRNIHGVMDALKEDALIAADYAARIGRMLGL